MEVKKLIKNLKKPCPVCGGKKEVVTPDWEEYEAGDSGLTPEEYFRQQGFFVVPERTQVCPECCGRGFVLTEEGLELVGFLQDFFELRRWWCF